MVQTVSSWKKTPNTQPVQTGGVVPVSAWKQNPTPTPQGGFSKAYSAIGGAVMSAATEAGSEKSLDMQSALKNGWNTIQGTITDSADRLEDLFKNYHPLSHPVDTAIKQTHADIGLLNDAFLGITAPLEAARGLPVIGHVADAVHNLFGAIGAAGGETAGQAVDALPIPQESKDKIRPLASEVGALVAQIITGKVSGDAAVAVKGKVRSLTNELNSGLSAYQKVVDGGLPQQVPVEGQSVAQDIPFNNKYTPPEQLPTIDFGPKAPKGTLPTIDFGKPMSVSEWKASGKSSTPTSEADATPNGLDPLAAEARKYKSAEEFVKAQGEPVFRGVERGVTDFKPSSRGALSDIGEFSVSPDKKVARGYRAGGGVLEGYLSPKAKVKDIGYGFKSEDFTQARKDGFDAVRFINKDDEKEIQVFNPKIVQTKSQLTDFYNKVSKQAVKEFTASKNKETSTKISEETRKRASSGASDSKRLTGTERVVVYRAGTGKIKPNDFVTESKVVANSYRAQRPNTKLFKVTVPKESLVRSGKQGEYVYSPKARTGLLKETKGTGEQRAFGLSEGIEASAIEKGLTDSFGEDIPIRNEVSFADQAAKIADFINKNDAETVRAVALGNKAAPKGIVPELLAAALEKEASAAGDVAFLRDLAKSPLARQASEYGLRFRALQERDATSPTKIIQEVQKARSERVKESGQTVEEEATKIRKEAKAEVRKAAKESRPSWESFIKDITCGY